MENEIDRFFKIFPIGSINRVFELENFILNDFVINFASKIIQNKLDLRILDSTSLVLGDDEHNRICDIFDKFEPVINKPVAVLIELDDTYLIKLLEQSINMFTSKVLYIKIDKKWFNSKYKF